MGDHGAAPSPRVRGGVNALIGAFEKKSDGPPTTSNNSATTTTPGVGKAQPIGTNNNNIVPPNRNVSSPSMQLNLTTPQNFGTIKAHSSAPTLPISPKVPVSATAPRPRPSPRPSAQEIALTATNATGPSSAIKGTTGGRIGSTPVALHNNISDRQTINIPRKISAPSATTSSPSLGASSNDDSAASKLLTTSGSLIIPARVPSIAIPTRLGTDSGPTSAPSRPVTMSPAVTVSLASGLSSLPVSSTSSPGREARNRALSRWCSWYLARANCEQKIVDIERDLRDGVKLALLLEALTGKQIAGVQKKEPLRRIHAINNFTVVFAFLKNEDVHIQNIHIEGIVDGAERILPLVWQIILRYQFNSKKNEKNARSGLLERVNTVLSKGKENAPTHVANFTTAFQDGLALCALINRKQPDALDWRLVSKDSRANVERALQILEERWGIPRLLEPHEIIQNPDEKSVMTYVAMCMDKLEGKGSSEDLRSTLKDADGVLQSYKNFDFVHEMLNPATGVAIKDRRYHLRKYPRCFVAKEFVDWLVAKKQLNLKRREDAVAIGVALANKGVIKHVADNEAFADKSSSYWTVEQAATTTSVSVAASNAPKDSGHSRNKSGDYDTSSDGSDGTTDEDDDDTETLSLSEVDSVVVKPRGNNSLGDSSGSSTSNRANLSPNMARNRNKTITQRLSAEEWYNNSAISGSFIVDRAIDRANRHAILEDMWTDEDMHMLLDLERFSAEGDPIDIVEECDDDSYYDEDDDDAELSDLRLDTDDTYTDDGSSILGDDYDEMHGLAPLAEPAPVPSSKIRQNMNIGYVIQDLGGVESMAYPSIAELSEDVSDIPFSQRLEEEKRRLCFVLCSPLPKMATPEGATWLESLPPYLNYREMDTEAVLHITTGMVLIAKGSREGLIESIRHQITEATKQLGEKTVALLSLLRKPKNAEPITLAPAEDDAKQQETKRCCDGLFLAVEDLLQLLCKRDGNEAQYIDRRVPTSETQVTEPSSTQKGISTKEIPAEMSPTMHQDDAAKPRKIDGSYEPAEPAEPPTKSSASKIYGSRLSGGSGGSTSPVVNLNESGGYSTRSRRGTAHNNALNTSGRGRGRPGVNRMPTISKNAQMWKHTMYNLVQTNNVTELRQLSLEIQAEARMLATRVDSLQKKQRISEDMSIFLNNVSSFCAAVQSQSLDLPVVRRNLLKAFMCVAISMHQPSAGTPDSSRYSSPIRETTHTSPPQVIPPLHKQLPTNLAPTARPVSAPPNSLPKPVNSAAAQRRASFEGCLQSIAKELRKSSQMCIETYPLNNFEPDNFKNGLKFVVSTARNAASFIQTTNEEGDRQQRLLLTALSDFLEVSINLVSAVKDYLREKDQSGANREEKENRAQSLRTLWVYRSRDLAAILKASFELVCRQLT